MKIETILKEATGISKLDAKVLLAALIQKDQAWMLAHPESELTLGDLSRWGEWLERREAGEPVAYITGAKEFYGRSFIVDPAVLIPRPSTETLIDLTLNLLKTGEDMVKEADTQIVIAAKAFEDLKDVKHIVDVGTGSGCIAITLALEEPSLSVTATDISEGALIVAESNASMHDVSIDFRHGNLLEPMADFSSPFILVSNPPYIPEDEELMDDVIKFEPHSALFSGKDGADAIRKLVAQAKAHPLCLGIVLECREEQIPMLSF